MAYEPFAGTQFLQSLTSTQGKNTLKHNTALDSSLFKRAVIEQRIKVECWHDIQMPADAIEIFENEAQYWQPVWGPWNGTGSRFARSEAVPGRCRDRCI